MNSYLRQMSKSFNLHAFKNFFSSTSASGMILFACLILSLIIANTPLGDGFNNILETQLGFENSAVHLRYSVALWINDGLMAIFFLLVGLEIKREVVEGELSSPKKAILPIICAIGGAIVPALIYGFFNGGKPTIHGWGIPMATDIAFALAILALLSDRVPVSLKIFLAALAIVEDFFLLHLFFVFFVPFQPLRGKEPVFLPDSGCIHLVLRAPLGHSCHHRRRTYCPDPANHGR